MLKNEFRTCPWRGLKMILEIVQLPLLAGIVVAAFMALKSSDLLKGTIFLAIMSLLLATEYYLLQAPDVAIAEAGVGAGLSTAIFVIAISKTSRWENPPASPMLLPAASDKQGKQVGK